MPDWSAVTGADFGIYWVLPFFITLAVEASLTWCFVHRWRRLAADRSTVAESTNWNGNGDDENDMSIRMSNVSAFLDMPNLSRMFFGTEWARRTTMKGASSLAPSPSEVRGPSWLAPSPSECKGPSTQTPSWALTQDSETVGSPEAPSADRTTEVSGLGPNAAWIWDRSQDPTAFANDAGQDGMSKLVPGDRPAEMPRASDVSGLGDAPSRVMARSRNPASYAGQAKE